VQAEDQVQAEDTREMLEARDVTTYDEATSDQSVRIRYDSSTNIGDSDHLLLQVRRSRPLEMREDPREDPKGLSWTFRCG